MNLKQVLNDLFTHDVNVCITDAYGRVIIPVMPLSKVWDGVEKMDEKTACEMLGTKVIKIVPSRVTSWDISFYEITVNAIKKSL